VLVGLLSTRPSIARLNPDGSLDLGFKAGGPGLPFGIGSVERMLLQTDGRLLIAGDFTVFSDEPRPGLVRLNPDGSLDQSFVPGFKNGDVRAIGLQPDGKVLVGGLLTLPEEHKPVTIVRLNADGSLDRWFDPGRAISEGVGIPLARVTALALQSDGQVLVAGQFNKINGVVRNGLARLNGGEPLAVRSVSRLGDGRVQLQGTVPRSHSYIFEASSDLIQWIPIHTNSIPAGTFQLVDDEAAQLGRRFYRLKAQP
jgi:uncharacterized delta-60 repeat protein